jgi:hypothetical protein
MTAKKPGDPGTRHGASHPPEIVAFLKKESCLRPSERSKAAQSRHAPYPARARNHHTHSLFVVTERASEARVYVARAAKIPGASTPSAEIPKDAPTAQQTPPTPYPIANLDAPRPAIPAAHMGRVRSRSPQSAVYPDYSKRRRPFHPPRPSSCNDAVHRGGSKPADSPHLHPSSQTTARPSASRG